MSENGYMSENLTHSVEETCMKTSAIIGEEASFRVPWTELTGASAPSHLRVRQIGGVAIKGRGDDFWIPKRE